MKLQSDPLFVAVTRPPMKWGVTVDSIILSGGIIGMIFVASGALLILLLYIPLHTIMYLLCLKDPQIIRLLMLWASTKLQSTGWYFWGAATATPMSNTRNKKGIPP